MSRIGNLPIKIEEGVKVEANDDVVKVSGPLGELSRELPSGISVKVENGDVVVSRKGDQKQTKSDHGTIRALISNMITGVKEGFRTEMEVMGVGYRAVLEGSTIVLSIGYNHPVRFEVPSDVKVEIRDNVFVTFSGIDKQKVGLWASKLRKLRKPEPYKGKGIRYIDEVVRRKPTKSAKEEIKK